MAWCRRKQPLPGSRQATGRTSSHAADGVDGRFTDGSEFTTAMLVDLSGDGLLARLKERGVEVEARTDDTPTWVAKEFGPVLYTSYAIGGEAVAGAIAMIMMPDEVPDEVAAVWGEPPRDRAEWSTQPGPGGLDREQIGSVRSGHRTCSKEVAMGAVVVGLDGSPGSCRAMALALEEARLRDDEVVAVHVYSYTLPDLPDSAVGTPEVIQEVIANAQRRASRCVDEALEAAGELAEGVTVTRHVVRDREPAKTLLDLSKGADLLVVGSRGLGGFAGLILGSVAQKCVQHATCPVIVVGPAPA